MSPCFSERPIYTASVWSKSLAKYISRLCFFAGSIWKRDIMVADMKDLEEMDASELHARRLNAKELLTPQRSGNPIFPNADGTVKIFVREQRLRTSTLNQNEDKNKKFLKKSRMNHILRPNFKTTRPGMMRKLKMTSGRSQENSFVVITLYIESNCTCRK